MAFAKYLHTAAKDASLALVHGMRKGQFRAYCAGVKGVAHDLEKLNPQPAGRGPNVEYPWEGPDGVVRTPAEEEFQQERALNTPAGVSLLKTVKLLLTKYEAIHR